MIKLYKRIGILIFAVLGILYGLLLFVPGALFLTPQAFKDFISLLGFPPSEFYFFSAGIFVIGSFFVVAGSGLFWRRCWARQLFLWGTFFHFLFTTYLFVFPIHIPGGKYGFPNPSFADVADYFLILVTSAVAFYFFNRKDIKVYFSQQKRS